MAKVRVPRYQQPRGYVDVDPEATRGATIGRDVYTTDGTLYVPPVIPAQDSGLAATYWRLIREVPANLQKLAALIGVGFTSRTSTGDWVQRSLQPGAGIMIENGDGQTGDPVVALAPLTKIADIAMSGHRIIRATGEDSASYADVMQVEHGDDVLGMTTSAADAGSRVPYVTDAEVSEPSWSWAPLQPLYLGANGLVTQIPPAPADGAMFSLVVGFATSATSARIRIEPPIYFED